MHVRDDFQGQRRQVAPAPRLAQGRLEAQSETVLTNRELGAGRDSQFVLRRRPGWRHLRARHSIVMLHSQACHRQQALDMDHLGGKRTSTNELLTEVRRIRRQGNWITTNETVHSPSHCARPSVLRHGEYVRAELPP